MREVVKYEADDGSTWDTADQAEDRDRLVAAVAAAMVPLGHVPRDAEWFAFSNGRTYIQHYEHDVARAKRAMLEILKLEFPTYAQERPAWFDGTANCRGHVLNMAADSIGGPIAKAWGRILRIDECNREWGQEYHAANPNTAAKAWKRPVT